MKRFIMSLLLVVVSLVSISTAEAATFKDVKPSTEQGQAIQSLVEQGIISGYSDGTFRPNEYITRAQVAKILTNALYLDVENAGKSIFSDVKPNSPSAPYIMAIVEAEIVNASSDTFRPNGKVTRGQIAKMLTIGFGLVGDGNKPFKDVKKNEDQQYVDALFTNEITKGKTKTEFGLNGYVTRGQIALFIARAQKAAERTTFYFVEESFDADHIYGDIVYLYSSDNIDLYNSSFNRRQSVVKIVAKAPGHTVFFIGPYTLDNYYGFIGEAKFFDAVTTKENGKLYLTVTERSEPVYDPAILFVEEGMTDFELTTLDGEPLYIEFYELQQAGSLTWLNIYSGAEQFFLTEQNTNGETYTFGVEYYQKGPYAYVDKGIYTPTTSYYLSENQLELYGLEVPTRVKTDVVYDDEDETYAYPQAVEATVQNKGIMLKVVGEGYSELLITQADDSVSTHIIETKKFGEGYVINFY